MCISTVADIPNTKKNSRVFPAISLKDMPMMIVAVCIGLLLYVYCFVVELILFAVYSL